MKTSSSKTGLFLMELIISILFFSIAAAICIQLFVQSHLISKESVALNHSILLVQNAAEAFYGCNGNLTEMEKLLATDNGVLSDKSDMLTLYYDEDFSPAILDRKAAYSLIVMITKEEQLLVCDISFVDTKTSASVYTLHTKLFPQRENAYES